MLIDLGFDFKDGKDYYCIVVDKIKEEYFIVKNGSCYGHVHKELNSRYGGNWLYTEKRFKIYSNGNNSNLDIKIIALKYRKFKLAS